MPGEPPANPPSQGDPSGAAAGGSRGRYGVLQQLVELEAADTSRDLRLLGEDIEQPAAPEPPPAAQATLRSLIPVTEASQMALKWATQKLGRKISSALTLQAADWAVLWAACDEERHRYRSAYLKRVPEDVRPLAEEDERVAWKTERNEERLRSRMKALRNMLDESRSGKPREVPPRNPAEDLNTLHKHWNDWRKIADQAEAGTGSEKITEEFKHSPDYRSVAWQGRFFSFTPNQAAIVEALHGAFENKTPEVAGATLLERAAESRASRVRDVFKTGDGKKAWGSLIKRGRTKGTYRLAL